MAEAGCSLQVSHLRALESTDRPLPSLFSCTQAAVALGAVMRHRSRTDNAAAPPTPPSRTAYAARTAHVTKKESNC